MPSRTWNGVGRWGDSDFARVSLDRVRAATDTESQFRQHPVATLLGVLAGILEGEILRDAGDLDASIAALDRAVALEDELDFDEPEPLPFSARHWLGSALLAAERYADAERVYRAELADHPRNGWSLHGLKSALAARGRSALAVDLGLDASWARSDTWLRGSRF